MGRWKRASCFNARGKGGKKEKSQEAKNWEQKLMLTTGRKVVPVGKKKPRGPGALQKRGGRKGDKTAIPLPCVFKKGEPKERGTDGVTNFSHGNIRAGRHNLPDERGPVQDRNRQRSRNPTLNLSARTKKGGTSGTFQRGTVKMG